MKRSVSSIRAEIKKLEKRIFMIQNNCKHANVFKSFGSNTGNYDAPNRYWINYVCNDCDKRWRVETT